MHCVDTRHKAVIHYKHFLPSLRIVSKIYGVSKSSLNRWVFSASAQRNLRKKQDLALVVKDTIKRILTSNPFATASVVADHLRCECNLKRSRHSVSRYIRQVGYSKKKAYRIVHANHDHDTIQQFCNNYSAAENGLICIDETGFYVGETFSSGYAPIGKRLNVPKGKTLRCSKFSVIMAVSCQGIVHYDVLDHNCKKSDFLRFLQGLNAPTGSTLLMDNIPFHRSKETLDTIRNMQCKPLYIPPYSPRFNAIEYVFSTMKHAYRSRCPAQSTTHFDYEACIHRSIQAVSSQGFQKYFDHVKKAVRSAFETIQLGEDVLGYDVT
jgi:transposase